MKQAKVMVDKKGKKKLFINGEDLGEFKGVPARDLEINDTFQEQKEGKIVTRKIIEKVEVDGLLIVHSVEVGDEVGA